MPTSGWQERATDILATLQIKLSKGPSGQSDLFFADGRLKLVGAGEGSGKSFLGALYGLCRAISDSVNCGGQPLLIWIVGADYEDARKEAEYLVGPDQTWLEDLGILDRGNSS